MSNAQIIREIQESRETLLNHINTRFDNLIAHLESPQDVPFNSVPKEWIVPLTVDPAIFVRQKTEAVIFGDERVSVKTWSAVCKEILQRCNQDPTYHDRLMELRGRTAGKVRVFLSDKTNGMSRPLKIDEDLYMEDNYGSQTMMHILVERILKPVGYGCSHISIVLKT